jgi:hypothetical protein
MTGQQTFGIAAFRSRQMVLRFDGALRRAGIASDIVSTPREVAVGCGLSVRFDLRDWNAVQTVYRQMPTGNLIGFYQVIAAPAQRPQIVPMR